MEEWLWCGRARACTREQTGDGRDGRLGSNSRAFLALAAQQDFCPVQGKHARYLELTLVRPWSPKSNRACGGCGDDNQVEPEGFWPFCLFLLLAELGALTWRSTTRIAILKRAFEVPSEGSSVQYLFPSLLFDSGQPDLTDYFV